MGPFPARIWVSSPGASPFGWEIPRTGTAERARTPVGRRGRKSTAAGPGFPRPAPPDSPQGAVGNYLLKRRPLSHLFAVNNPRHLGAFIKPFPSPRPHYFNNKSRVTFQRRY